MITASFAVGSVFITGLNIGRAMAADTGVTHVVANAWQSSDFHDPVNPGCSIGGAGSMPGSRLMMGASRLRPDPMNLVIRKTGWQFPPGTSAEIATAFPDGSSFEFVGQGRGDSIEIGIPADKLREWVHELTASDVMQLSFVGNEPAWTFDLAGTTTVVNAMDLCFRAHAISGVAPPFETATVAGAGGTPASPAPSSMQPFGAVRGGTFSAQPAQSFGSQPRSSVGEQVLMQWSGSGRMQTRPFHIDGPWELQWSRDNGYFSATLHNASGTGDEELLANGIETPSSTFYHPTGGDFYFDFDARAGWRARIVAVPLPGATAATQPVTNLGMETTTLAPRRAVTPPSDPGMPPSGQLGLLAAVEAAQQQYREAPNDMAKGAARPVRARALCRAVASPHIEGWLGKISKLSTNGEGKGVISIQIGPDTYVRTWNNAFSDIADNTLIDPSTPLFRVASSLKEGQKVRFSAILFPNATDCYKEGSMTMDGSITAPEFIMRLTNIEAIP
jgi:hypothetical protein